MYSFMIPTMQKVLSEIRDLVVLKTNRDYFEDFTLHPTTIPLTSVTWNWNEYYKSISINGLEETNCYKDDFPKDTDQLYLLLKYIEYGHKELQP